MSTSLLPSAADDAPLNQGVAPRRFWEPQWLFLVLLVVVGYLLPLSLPPLVGEETRRATCATEMLRTGDFIVHRQQNMVYLSRPPLGSWAIALIGAFRGQVDELAIRLPSALATLFTTLLVYWYTRRFSSPLAALAAGCVFATFGQVLEMGRLGESEAPFTFFVAASLLVWHHGYASGWPPLATWVAGYTLTGLAALIKGPQAPVYFVAAVVCYLICRKETRKLWTWSHCGGVLAILVVIGCWQVPYLMQQGWRNTWLTWFGLAIEKATDLSLPRHMVRFPVELFVCLLPWSVWLPALLFRRVRQSLATVQPVVLFLVVCLVVTFPTVWLASAARSRYYMPLYPCIAVLVGLVIDRCSLAAHDASLFSHWQRFARGGAAMAATAIVVVGVLTFVPLAIWQSLRPTLPIAATLVAAAALGAVSLWKSSAHSDRHRCELAVASLAGLVALLYAGLIVPAQARALRNGHLAVGPVKSLLPPGASLTSLDPVHHWFVYHLGEPLPMTRWPRTANDLPGNVEYFCFDWHRGDTPEQRRTEFGQLRWKTPGTLPFAWEEIARVPCDRRADRESTADVIIGRVLRDEPEPRMAGRVSDPRR